ncbi:hypothetical protein H0H93_012006 [Arthromyces matolae]|nr:hypothetical protein H0H93_012006 [Arthromyces matolae]
MVLRTTRSGAVFSPYVHGEHEALFDHQAITSPFHFDAEPQLQHDHLLRQAHSLNESDPDAYYLDPDDDDDGHPGSVSSEDSDMEVSEEEDNATVSPNQSIRELFSHLSNKQRRKRLRRFLKRFGVSDSEARAMRFVPKIHNAPFANTLKRVSQKRRRESKPILVDVDLESRPVSTSGWLGAPSKVKPAAAKEVRELVDERGFKFINWDGKTTHPLVDGCGRVIGLLAGEPRDTATKHHSKLWTEAVDNLADAMRDVRAKLKPRAVNPSHRRGTFGNATVGIGFGNGRQQPMNFKQDGKYAKLYRDLCDGPAARVAHYQASMFRTYAPRIHQYYSTHMEKLLNRLPFLHHNFKRSVFAACTFNLGPRTITLPHLDRSNLAFGWCAITALGNFNPDLGGYFVIWELGLVIRFPPGATILIPSAILTHSNLPIAEGEERLSFTQFTAGCLLRYIHNGFMTDKELLAKATKDQLEEREEERASRWLNGLGLFSQLNEFS